MTDTKAPVVNVPATIEDEGEKIAFATEVAFLSLVNHAKKDQIIPAELPVMGLMYLPSQAVTQQFKQACAAVITCLKEEAQPGEAAVHV